jgi:hypothetical protein
MYKAQQSANAEKGPKVEENPHAEAKETKAEETK